jgi:energy-coupling factor transporter ATP-binding protein EcfA2
MGRRDALVVGINKYPFLKDSTGKYNHLTTPASDAEAIAQLLERYGEFQVERLPTVNQNDKQQVNPQEVVKLQELERAITNLFCPQGGQIPETAVLFFAGHGLRRNLDNGTEGYLATSDANPRKELRGMSLQWLRQILHDSPVRQQIIWLDCCHSGELLNFAKTDLGESEKGRDRFFIVASRDHQVAYAQADGKHGVLSGALLRGLDPRQQPDKWVTNVTLVNFVKEALKDAPQHPIYTEPDGQIILTGQQSVISGICPYKGLGYFGFNDEDYKYFYGRTALTNQLLKKLRQSNLIAVLGASGSGKSSVVRAGLLHQLKQGEILPGSDRWKIYEPFTPGEHPLQNLEQVIKVKADQIQALINVAAAERVVLVVDQFEEVFTLCRDDTERQKFFEYLLGAVKQLGNKLCLVLVMRADFQGKCAEKEYAGLATQIYQNRVEVLPMEEPELREAIIKPAERVGLIIDRELVNQMIVDVSGSPGDLPLLQYILTELWEQRTLNRLTINNFTRLGGVKKALENHANEIFKKLSTEEQLVAKQIFLELTHLGEGTEDTRQQVCQEDLITSKRSPDLVEKVIQRLAKEKLIVTGEQEFGTQRVPVVNIIHDTLIQNWEKLRAWLTEHQEELLKKQEIEDAAKKWRSQYNKNNLQANAYIKRNNLTTPFIHYYSLLAAPNNS